VREKPLHDHTRQPRKTTTTTKRKKRDKNTTKKKKKEKRKRTEGEDRSERTQRGEGDVTDRIRTY